MSLRSKTNEVSLQSKNFSLSKIIKDHYIFLTILILSIFVRFWNVSELMFFTLDEEIEAFIVKNIVTGYHFPAIGVSVAPVGIHLSPLFYYLATIPFWLGGLNPIAWGITASILGVITTLVLYLTTREMFSQRIAIFASLLYSGSFLMVLYDKHFWNVTPMPLIAIVVIYSLYKIIKDKLWWSIPLSFALALGLSSHLSTLTLLILVLIVWIRDKLPIFKKPVMLGAGILLVSQLPLLFFEIRHNFSQSQALLKFFTGEHSGVSVSRILDNLSLLPKVYSRLLYTFGKHDFAREHTYGLVEIIQRDASIPTIMLALSIVLLLFFGYLLYKNFKNHAMKLHGVFILITIISLIFYGILFKGGIFEFYLAVIFPSLFVAAALVLDWVWPRQIILKTLAALFIIVFLAANFWAVLTAYHSYGFSKKIEVIGWVKKRIKQEPYELHSIGVNHKYEGYRYLFEKFYKAPVKSYVDPQLAWLYQQPVGSSAELMVVITSTEPDYKKEIEDEKEQFNPYKIDEAQFGEISVMIISNANRLKKTSSDTNR